MKKTLIFFIITIALFFTHSVLATYKLEITYPKIQGVEAANKLNIYLRYIYIYGLTTLGIAALGALVVGGIMYMAAGSITSTEEAKKIIWGAIGGLLLGLSAYLILNTINPDLTLLKEPTLEKVTIEPIEPGTAPPFPPYEGLPAGADAGHPNLIKLTECIQNKIPEGYTRQPYVDSAIGGSCTNVCSSYSAAGCNHSRTSDHYGCKCGGNYSYAVDLSTSDANQQCRLAQAARECSSETGISIKTILGSSAAGSSCPNNIGYWPGHEDHTHISIPCQ